MSNPSILEQDVERRLADQLARMSMGTSGSARPQKIQEIMARLAALNDSDFDLTVRALEGFVNSAVTRNQENLKNQSKADKAKSLAKDVGTLTSSPKKPLF